MDIELFTRFLPTRKPRRRFTTAGMAAFATWAAISCVAPDAAPQEPAAAVSAVEAGGESRERQVLSDAWREGRSEGGHFTLKWRPAEEVVPRNREFAIDVLLLGAGGPLSGATINVRGWMPEHGHGFVRQPIVVEKGGGLYHVEGVLLHMRGKWQLIFDVKDKATSDVVVFDLDLN